MTYALFISGDSKPQLCRWYDSDGLGEPSVTTVEVDSYATNLLVFRNELMVVHAKGSILWLDRDLNRLRAWSINELLNYKAVTSDERSVKLIFETLQVDGPRQVYQIDCTEIIGATEKAPVALPLLKIPRHCQDIVFSQQGRLVTVYPDGTSIVLDIYSRDYSSHETLRIPVNGADPASVSVRWLGELSLLIAIGTDLGVWDAKLHIKQDSIGLSLAGQILFVTTPKPGEAAAIVIQTAADLRCFEIPNFHQENLLCALGQYQSRRDNLPAWYVDLGFQDTWKGSLVNSNRAARDCLSNVAKAKSGVEIDGYVTMYHTSLGALTSNSDCPSETRSDVGTLTQNKADPFPASFVDELRHILRFRLSKEVAGSAKETWRILKAQGLARSVSEESNESVHKLLPGDSEAVSATPTTYVHLLRECLDSNAEAEKGIAKVLPQLMLFDNAHVVKALKQTLGQQHIERLIVLLQPEFFENSNARSKSLGHINETTMCLFTTLLLDALGCANLILTDGPRDTLLKLASNIDSLVLDCDATQDVSACLHEFLQRSRMQDARTTELVSPEAVNSAYPVAKSSSTLEALRTLVAPRKELSIRAKAQMRASSIGTNYTIELLHI